MATNDGKQGKAVDRRTFLKSGIIAGGALAGAGLAIRAVAEATGDSGGAAPPSGCRSGAWPSRGSTTPVRTSS
jgi:hypothetical protein